MSMPDGTSKIIYSILQYGQNNGPDLGAEATFAVTANDPERVDIAAAAAMDTFVATLEATSSSPVTTFRTYQCSQQGDSWPTPKS